VRILVSNNSELLRHLATAPFRSIPMEILVVTGGLQAVQSTARDRPSLALLDAEMSDLTGYEAARAIKHANEACRIVLVLSGRVSARQMRLVTESGCDEVLIVPAPVEHLYDIVAGQLQLPRRSAERHPVDLALLGRDGHGAISGRVTNLSIHGARLVLNERIDDGAALRLELRPDGEPPIVISARAVWTQPGELSTAVGAAFDNISPDARRHVARLTRWDIIQGVDRTHVSLGGELTEDTHLEDLAPALLGKVDFDMSQLSYMNSLGVRAWVDFLDRAPIRDYEFHACSVAFVLQAALVDGVLGSGTVVSFFAPYACEQCEQREEHLLQSAAIVRTGTLHPPVFSCSRCDGQLLLDEFPDRYFAFLRGARVA
jgi:CheY-like chemotaxis protein